MKLESLPSPIYMIACIDEKNGIGRNGNLLVHIEEDMRLFKSLTMHQAVIMGRNTMESLPLGNPLKGRINIVLSTSMQGSPSNIGEDSAIKRDNCVNDFLICRNIAELSLCMEKIAGIYHKIEFWCIGGEMVYRLLLPYTREIRLTRISGDYGADTFFPEITQFKCIEKNILSGISFERYIRADV